MSKLALGTVQFGIDYGINNKRGKVPRAEAFEILGRAAGCGVDTLDTASSYGDSEEAIGEFLKSGKGAFKIISKLPDCGHSGVQGIFRESLRRLGVSRIYGYLVHSFSAYKNDERIWDGLVDIKAKGKAEKVGFSLYSPDELEYLLDNGTKFDIVQLPFSIFDRRFEGYLPGLKKAGVEVHARSIFLQGLAFKKPEELGGHFKSIKDNIEGLGRMARELGLSTASLCVNFAVANRYIDKVVVGVDSLQNFTEIAEAVNGTPIDEKTMEAVSVLKIEDEDVLLPSRWKLSKVAR